MYRCQLLQINLGSRLETQISEIQLIYSCIKVIHNGERLTLERRCAKSCNFIATGFKNVVSTQENKSLVLSSVSIRGQSFSCS